MNFSYFEQSPVKKRKGSRESGFKFFLQKGIEEDDENMEDEYGSDISD
jgi:hypothetical protein